MQRSCLVLPHRPDDGPANMALDEALLDAVASRGDASYLRTYEWTVPTLSLGYFQRIDDVRSDPRWLGVPMVRRQTGGGAIWHHHEITYTLVVPASHPLARPSTCLYRAVHAAVSQALAGLGIRTKRRGDDPDRPDRDPKRSLLCFTEAHADDRRQRAAPAPGRGTPAWVGPVGSISFCAGATWCLRCGGCKSRTACLGRGAPRRNSGCAGNGPCASGDSGGYRLASTGARAGSVHSGGLDHVAVTAAIRSALAFDCQTPGQARGRAPKLCIRQPGHGR
jgi:hypothetical protein